MMPRVVVAAAMIALAGTACAADNRYTPLYSPQPMVTGDLEVGLGRLYPAAGPDLGAFTATGRANMPIQGALNLELQATANAVYLSGMSQSSNDVYAHAWWRQPSSAWGIFGGTEFLGPVINAAGAEGKFYFGNISVGVEAARLWTNVGAFGWEVAANANLYLQPNLRVGAGVQRFTDFGADLTVWSLDAEARFAGSPWSIWGYASSFSIAGTTSYVALGGFKWFMDAPNSTLQSHEKDVPFWFKSLPPIF